MSDEKYAELVGRLAVLEMQVDSMERILLALALATPVSRRADLLELVHAISINAAASDGQDVSRWIDGFAEQFLSLVGPDSRDSIAQIRVSIALQSALLAAAPKGQKEAMRSWLAIATPQEISDESRELLKSLPPMPADLKGKKRSPRSRT